jgi:HEAT repeat protein
MDFKQILELVGREHVPGNEEITGFLEDAVASFETNAHASAQLVRELQTKDPSGFTLAAVRLLVSAQETSRGLQFLANLVTAEDVLIEPLADMRALPPDAALRLAGRLSAADPLLDVRLVRKVVERAGGDVRAITSGAALHVLGLVGEISDCSRLASYLVQFLSHPSAKVRSKAVLLLGRANRNLRRVKSFLAANDGRVRANAVETLWRHCDPDVLKILWEATRDPFARVALNAYVGLCRAGDQEAHKRLAKLAESQDSVLRTGAAWAMGETGDPGFGKVLEKLKQDANVRVRAMAEKSGKRLRDNVTPP